MQPPEPPPALVVQELGKRFDIYPNDRSRFFEFLGTRTHHTAHWALRGVSFQVPKGRAFGIIGSNGAGKSTLLRILGGITEPSEGTVTVQGRLATLLDLGVSFHPSFSGRENIQLTCQLLGMDDALIEERIPEIIQFAEISEFIDHPVRTYSTGMHLRLGFAIATHSNADVLVVDEVLAVGDQYFQRKCIRRIEAALGDGATIVLVSHDLHAIRSLCDEALWLDGGRMRALGPPREVVERYLELDRVRGAPDRPAAPPPLEARPSPPATSPPAPETAHAPEAPRASEARGRRIPSLPSTPLVPHDPHPRMEEDPHLLDLIAAATQVADPVGAFGAPAGEAPRAMEGDKPVVLGTGEARILRVQILDHQGVERQRFRTGESVIVAVTFRTTEPLTDPIFGIALFRSDGVYVFGPNTGFDEVLHGTWHGVYTFFLHYPRLPLLTGMFRLSVAIFDAGHLHPHVWHNQLYDLEVAQDVEDHGLVQLPHQWGMLRWYEPR